MLSLVLGLGHETLDAEPFHRCDLVVDAGEFRVHCRDAGMQILDPLIERRRQRAVLGKGRPDKPLAGGRHAGHAEAGNEAPLEELTPVDLAAAQLFECRLLQKILKFLAFGHV